jgi:asparagine synthase (glutamine-hydrolysing)
LSFLWGETVSELSQPAYWYCEPVPLSARVQPTTGPEASGDLIIAADAELHNGDDLFRALGPAAPSTGPGAFPGVNDACLIIASYEKWGEDCAARLLGDFAFAIWDKRRRRLFCCRDHLGIRPFFYWHQASRFVFASHPVTILRSSGVPRQLNRRKLAAMAVNRGKQFRHEETFHTGIFSLPPGSCVTFDAKGIRKWSYWNAETAASDVPKRDPEALEALRELLFESVDVRTRNLRTVGVQLSGGLDSSAIMAIAARQAARANRELTALSVVLPETGTLEASGQPQQLQDEREYIDEFRSWPNVRIHYVTAPHRGPFDDITGEGRFETTFDRASNYFLFQAIQETASPLGVDVLLNGVGGELGPTCWGTEYHLELATRFRWFTLASELRALRAVQGIHPLRALGRPLLDALHPSRGFRPLMYFSAGFAGECDASPNTGKRHWPNHRTFQREMLRRWTSAHANAPPFHLSGGIRQTSPFIDKRVIEFCIAAPGRLKVAGGYRRNLIRRSLDGILPRKIQWRTTKAPFSPDYYVRYNAQIGKAREFVAAIGPRDPVGSVVDVDLLRRNLHPVDPITGTWDALVSVPMTIYLIAFLRQFAEFRP